MTAIPRDRLPRPRDAGIAVAAAAFVLVTSALSAGPGDRPLWPAGVALVVAGAAALAWRHRAPVLVLGLTLAAVAPYYWMGLPDGPAATLVAIAMYTVASRLSWPRSVVAGLVLLGVWVGLEQVLALRDGRPIGEVDHYGWIVVVVAVGVAVGGLRRAQTEAADRAEEQARRRGEQERLRIAREVHDVVSHSLAMIAVQAGVGAHVADRRPDRAVAALLEIKEASRAALGELRATLDVLRGGELETEPGPPASGLDRLPELTRGAALSGIEVDVRGSAGVLTAETDAVAFRIVREAVTNVVRHARRAHRVTVELANDTRELRLRVSDDGEPVGALVPGNGLLGLAEQAVSVGGRSTAGPGARGVVVEAVLPLAVTAGRPGTATS